uniref:Uncharacterized protein n=1 Tax=Timema shepardi TaxID=629360 RepID=A0A7R9FXA7_TIMSH|nr:unnamed protein product [Timema shepardi]
MLAFHLKYARVSPNGTRTINLPFLLKIKFISVLSAGPHLLLPVLNVKMVLQVRWECGDCDNAPPILKVPERTWELTDTELVDSIVTRVKADDDEDDPLVFGLEMKPALPGFPENLPLPLRIDNTTGVVYINDSLKGRSSLSHALLERLTSSHVLKSYPRYHALAENKILYIHCLLWPTIFCCKNKAKSRAISIVHACSAILRKIIGAWSKYSRSFIGSRLWPDFSKIDFIAPFLGIKLLDRPNKQIHTSSPLLILRVATHFTCTAANLGTNGLVPTLALSSPDIWEHYHCRTHRWEGKPPVPSGSGQSPRGQAGESFSVYVTVTDGNIHAKTEVPVSIRGSGVSNGPYQKSSRPPRPGVASNYPPRGPPLFRPPGLNLSPPPPRPPRPTTDSTLLSVVTPTAIRAVKKARGCDDDIGKTQVAKVTIYSCHDLSCLPANLAPGKNPVALVNYLIIYSCLVRPTYWHQSCEGGGGLKTGEPFITLYHRQPLRDVRVGQSCSVLWRRSQCSFNIGQP